MGINRQERCMGCMKTLDWDGRCSNCGFDKSKYANHSRYLPLGTSLKKGEYMVGKVLGEGGFGITYIGFDRNLLSRVAIKEYYPKDFVRRDVSDGNHTINICSDEYKDIYEKELSAFLEEARILAQLAQMEGIVNVRNLFQENGTAYIVMEYVEGVSVRQYLQGQNKIEAGYVLEMMEQPIRALHAIHEKGFIHRDVSADNFIIGQNGKLTLIDFGAAHYLDVSGGKSQTTIYKEGFSAIEQYSPGGKLGPWTDVYGICATMYYMMTGIIPQNPPERVVDDEVVSLEKIPEILLDPRQKHSIMMGMSVNIKERFQNMEFLYNAIYGKSLAANLERDSIFLKNNIPFVPNENIRCSPADNLPTGISGEALQISIEKTQQKRKKEYRKFVIKTIAKEMVSPQMINVWVQLLDNGIRKKYKF